MWETLPLIAPILLEGWWGMHCLSLCCSVGLGVVFDPRSHTCYPPYELMSRNWYVPFCCTWYQERRGPCRSIRDEKSKTIPVPGGAVLSLFQIESQLCPGLESGTQRVPHKIQHTLIGSVPVVMSVAFPFSKGMVCQFSKWRSVKCFWKLSTPIFFHFLGKEMLFFRNEIDNLLSNFTGKMMQCISID
jgi:hypothetical protein